MRRLLGILLAAFALVAAPRAAHAQAQPARALSLAFGADGTVTLHAQGVTPREILMEWARQCGCYIVNADKLTAAPLQMPVLFEHASQSAVLESLLRQAAGYVLTPKRPGARGASNFEVIYILPASTAVAAPTISYATSATYAVPITTAGSPADEIPPVQPVRTSAPPPAPAANAPAGGLPSGTFLPTTPTTTLPSTTPTTPTTPAR